MTVIEEIGLAAETTGGTAVNIAALTDQLISLGKTDKDIATILGNLQTMDGIVPVSYTHLAIGQQLNDTLANASGLNDMAEAIKNFDYDKMVDSVLNRK